MLSINDKVVRWNEKFPDHTVKLDKLPIHSSWKKLFSEEMKKPYFEKLTEYLSHCLDYTEGKVQMYPYPDLLFNAFNMTPLDKIKVVILGQDPYHQNEMHDGKKIPQAMGLSFSVPVGIKVPSSLCNIYKNLQKFGHIDNIPNHGNLSSWAKQGCLLLNTSLTVQHGNPNSHAKYWQPFTDAVIKYLSNNCDHIIFVLWGGPSLDKLRLIDTEKHDVIASSHPSGLSFTKPLRSYSAFIEQDHFGIINSFLEKSGGEKIKWQI